MDEFRTECGQHWRYLQPRRCTLTQKVLSYRRAVELTRFGVVDMRSINTAWLSVASSVAALVVPAAYKVHAGTAALAVSLAVFVSILGEKHQV